nr:hypothetical protein [Tanacetum cinerariifolium]
MPLLKKFALLMKTRVSRGQRHIYNSQRQFGDSYEAPQEVVDTGSASEGSAKKKGRTVTVMTEDMQKRRNDVKARTTLLLALPDEHQLRFSKYKTAQELWAAILKTFGRNEATKKTMKNQLKQQYGNFKAEGKEILEQTFNRLHDIVSHLEFIDVKNEQDDLNQKFLTSLAPEWLMYTIVWRNRSDLDTMSLDDVYNYLKVYELEVQKKLESNSQNMAFISSAKNISGNGEVNTASIPTASTQVSPASANIAAASISLDTACAYIASQSNGSQIKYEDINRIDEDDNEEMDIKWNMALLIMRADKYWKKTGKKISIQGTDVAGFDKSKVECFNCHKMGHFYREYREPRIHDRGRRENFKQGSKVEESAPKALMAIDGVGWDWRYMENKEEDHALVADQEAPTKFSLMAKSSYDTENVIDDKDYWDSGCSWHMTGNISYLSDYEPYDGGYVSFGQGGCKITDKGTIKTGKLEFENVYFVKDLKYNLFSVSQICDNKNNVLFTDLECIVLGREFKLRDYTNVLLRTPRKHNMYSIDLNNIIPHKDLTCLVAKASADERTDHKASCMTKLVNSVTKPLYTLYMDLFGPTSDETSGILRNFITEIENLKELKVKIIRCDNRGEFRNKEMNDFCSKKGIKREFSNARTPQQNGVAERRNRTLIEAARTMLADAKLPVTFWAEAVNTACYVQNRVLVNKSQNKTSYELFNGRTPAIGFLNPFGCHVMILNTLDNLGKFEAKGDEGYFIGYSMSSKAFMVFNKRTKRVKENLHVEFLENKLIEKRAFPNWLFDIDTLTNYMNYVPAVSAGTTSTNFLGTKEATSQDVKKDVSSLRYITLPNWFHEAHLETSTSDSHGVEADLSNMENNISASPTPTLRIHKDHLTCQIIGPVDTLKLLEIAKIIAQDLEIASLKARIKLLKDKNGGGDETSREDATIKGRSLETGEEAGVEKSTKKDSNDTEELVNVLTSLDAASILTSRGVQVVSVLLAAKVPTVSVPTGSGMVPTASPIFTTASVVTPYSKRKGKEKMVESDTPKKKRLQEQIDVQMAREMKEQLAKEDQRMNEQIARDAKIARIHAEEELQMLIDSLDRNNETVSNYMQEYEQFAADLSIGERIKLINDLVKYQDNYAKVLKYQSQQRKPLSKKQQREFYMSVLKSHSGWKAKHFNGMSLEEIRENFIPVWKQIEDFVPMGSKEERERFKRKGLKLEQDSAKKVKTSEEVSEEDLKTMMQLVPVEEIITLGGNTYVYQFFVDVLKYFDREDLNQLWTLVKETLSIRQATGDKEKEL